MHKQTLENRAWRRRRERKQAVTATYETTWLSSHCLAISPSPFPSIYHNRSHTTTQPNPPPYPLFFASFSSFLCFFYCFLRNSTNPILRNRHKFLILDLLGSFFLVFGGAGISGND
uniref:Uncharacterized protein n=1 Tax=Salix viminalis TaxID=40686 RepID=A0A6N2MWK8_SALVM